MEAGPIHTLTGRDHSLRKGSSLPVNVNGGVDVRVHSTRVVRSGPEAKASKDQDTLSHPFALSPTAAKMQASSASANSGRSGDLAEGSSSSFCILLPTSVISKLLQGGGCATQGLVSRAVSENIKNAYAW